VNNYINERRKTIDISPLGILKGVFVLNGNEQTEEWPHIEENLV